MQHKIGTNRETNKAVTLDVDRLIHSRALIQANSGGGKSYLLRVIAEAVAGEVQTIIFDWEGEFPSLRSRFDMMIVGDGGEVPCNVKTAEALTLRILKAGFSAVINLSDLDIDARREWVGRSCRAMIDAPKALWHHLIVGIDEAHEFCPEGSIEPHAKAVIALMAQGRKRGFCGILATQRLSKLKKDAAAECNNVFIGRTVLDTDQARAGSVLGWNKAKTSELRSLHEGQFWCYGPALPNDGIIPIAVRTSLTPHGFAKDLTLRTAVKPASKEMLAAISSDMKDITERDPDDPLTMEEAREIIGRLKARPAVREPVIPDDVQRDAAFGRAARNHLRDAPLPALRSIAGWFAGLPGAGDVPRMDSPHTGMRVVMPLPTTPAAPPPPVEDRVQVIAANVSGDVVLSPYAIGVVRIIVNFGRREIPESTLATLAGRTTGSSTWKENIRTLIAGGYIEHGEGKNTLRATPKAVNVWTPSPIPSGPDAIAAWRKRLPECAGALLEAVAGGARFAADIAATAKPRPYSTTSSTFKEGLRDLLTMQLIRKTDGGYILSDALG